MFLVAVVGRKLGLEVVLIEWEVWGEAESWSWKLGASGTAMELVPSITTFSDFQISLAALMISFFNVTLGDIVLTSK